MPLSPKQVAVIRAQPPVPGHQAELYRKLARQYGISASMVKKIRNGTRYAGNIKQKLGAALEPYMWKPGQSGNPKGNSRKGILSTAYKDRLQEPYGKTGRTVAEQIAHVVTRQAARGNIKAASEVADRTEGRAFQPLTGPNNTPLNPVQPPKIQVNFVALEKSREQLDAEMKQTNRILEGNANAQDDETEVSR